MSASLRTRLVAALFLLLTVAATLTAIGTAVALRKILTDRLDAELASDAAVLLAHMPPPGFQVPPSEVPAAISRYQSTGTVNAVVQGTGVVTAWQVRPAGAIEPVTPTAYPDLVSLAVGTPPRTVDLGPLGDHRMIAIFTPYGDRMAMGVPQQPVQDTMAALVVIELAVAGAVLLGVGLLARVVVRRALRPLTAVVATAAQASSLSLSVDEVSLVERVPDPHLAVDSELAQVGAALNHMLDHVEAALLDRQETQDQLRRFLTDTPTTSSGVANGHAPKHAAWSRGTG